MENHLCEKKEIFASLCGTQSELRPTGMLQLIQDIATEHAYRLKVDTPSLMEKDGAFWIITRARVNIFEKLYQSDVADAMTWPRPPEGFRCNRHTRFSKDGHLAFASVSEWVLVDAQTHKLRRADTVSYPFEMEHYPELAVEEPFSRLRDDLTPEELFETRKVRSSFIDLAHHVNNTVYMTLMMDTFSVEEIENMFLKGFEIVYSREALEGETISIYRRRTEDGWFFSIRKEDGTTAILCKLYL